MMADPLAEDLWALGAGHLLSATELVGAGLNRQNASESVKRNDAAYNGRFSASVYLLLGYSTELLLKSAYLQAGGKPDRLKVKLGHDLISCHVEAQRQGYQFETQGLNDLASTLRQSHLKHQFRYGWSDEIGLPRVEDALQILDDLAREVGTPFLEVFP